MKDTTTAPLNEGPQMGGNSTAEKQRIISITTDTIDNMRQLLLDLDSEAFYQYFRYQPFVIQILSGYALNRPPYEGKCITDFINALSALNRFLYDIVESRPILRELDDIVIGLKANATFEIRR